MNGRNGWTKYLVEILLVVLIGIGGWNLAVTIETKSKVDKVEQKLEDHIDWGTMEGAEMNQDIKENRNDIRQLEKDIAKLK